MVALLEEKEKKALYLIETWQSVITSFVHLCDLKLSALVTQRELLILGLTSFLIPRRVRSAPLGVLDTLTVCPPPNNRGGVSSGTLFGRLLCLLHIAPSILSGLSGCLLYLEGRFEHIGAIGNICGGLGIHCRVCGFWLWGSEMVRFRYLTSSGART